MIYQLSSKMTKWFIEKKLLCKEDYAVYVYCIDSLLARILFYSTMIIVAALLHILPITLFYYLMFIPYRYTAGGYHMQSELACLVSSWAVYAFSMLIIVNLGKAEQFLIVIIITILSVVTISVTLKLAPIEHTNKPMSNNQKLTLRKRCLVFQIIYLMAIMLFLNQHYYIYALSLAMGNSIAMIFLVVAYFSKRKGDENNEKFYY